VKIGIGFGFPLGNSHDITAIFPSVKLSKLFSFGNVLKGSKAERRKKKEMIYLN
jgi:hypothetical protein